MAWGRPNWPTRRTSSTSSSAPSRRGPPAQPSYSAATSAGRSTVSPGYSNTPGINQTVRDEYWGVPAGPYARSTQEYQGYRDYRRQGGGATTPTLPSFGGGGGGGRGGGGGGGGGTPPMTQAMFDAMLKAIGTSGPGLKLNQVNLPDFVGQRLGAFNAAPYTQALGSINQAVTADQAASAAAGQQASKALQGNYSNAYQQAQGNVTPAPQAQQVGTALQQSVGGGGDQAAVAAQSNAAGASDQASFANLLNVLAAADQQAQGSRMNQVALDQATALRGINAQALGMRGGVNQARAQAANQWQQAQAERDYQNQMMRQQWNREELMRNQDIGNQQSQGNWQQRNEMISSRLTPLLQLLQGTAGGKINTSALQQMLAGWQR
jgi:hypothetical protein